MIPVGDARAFKFEYKNVVNKILTPVGVLLPKDSGQQRQQLEKFTALWDTGATHTCITQEVVDSTKLFPTGIGKVNTANGYVEVERYIIDLMLPDDVVVQRLLVNKLKKISDAQLLIGMDIISLGDFAVTNQKKTTFTFRIPSRTTLDFVTETVTGRLPRAGRRKAQQKKI